jgi:MFS family permease
VSLFITDVREAEHGRLDFTGLILTGFAMAALMAGFETLGRDIVPLSWTLASLGTGLAALVLYILHERRAEHPILDLSLLSIPTFASSVIAGSLFRIAVGAMPFLLPLMLQLSFGESPLQSGLVTFASAAGAITMKPAVQPLLRRFGFRTVLVVNGVLASGFIIACATFQPSWPLLVLDVVLLAGGFFRSLQFTAFNTIAYGDISRARMSAATSLYTTIQQLTLTLGIVVGAAVLEIASTWSHHATASRADYALAFIVVGGISMLAVPFCARLDPAAGEELSGHHVSLRPVGSSEPGEMAKKARFSSRH